MIAFRVKERRCQKLRDIPVAGAVVLLCDKRRWFCDEYLFDRRSFCEPGTVHTQAEGEAGGCGHRFWPCCVRDCHGVRDFVVTDVQQDIGDAALRLPDVDLLALRMLGFAEHRYRSVRFF